MLNERIHLLQELEPKSSGQASYTAILETAVGLFQQFPADAFTLRDILTISGVSNQTLYNYFPAGRDDIAIALFDRTRREMVAAFHHQNQSTSWTSLPTPTDISRALSASLTSATLGVLRQNWPLHGSVFAYLKEHAPAFLATHHQEFEEALHQEARLRYGHLASAEQLPQISRLCIRVLREVTEEALAQPAMTLDTLASSTRKVLRVLLESGTRSEEAPSGSHGLPPPRPSAASIVGAAIKPSHQQAILSRMRKRALRKA